MEEDKIITLYIVLPLFAISLASIIYYICIRQNRKFEPQTPSEDDF